MTFARYLWRAAALVTSGLLLAGCLPASQSQSDEEKEPHFQAGKSRVSAMDYRGAVECFEKALEVNPQSASAHFELAWLYDQKEADPAAAIYHYEHYLRLRPTAENGEMVRTRVLTCKQELARAVSLGPVTQAMEKEFAQLTAENKRLREELETLRATLAAGNRATITPVGGSNTIGPTVLVARSFQPVRETTSVRPVPESLSGSTSTRSTPTASPSRTHIVKAGETPIMIARRYGIRVDALTAANPRLDARRMRVGQTLAIPGS